MAILRRAAAIFSAGFTIFVLVAAGPCQAQPLIFQPVATGLNSVTDIVSPRDGSGRLFIVQQNGLILIHDGQQLLGTPFLDLSGKTFHTGERGLLGLAFAPDYAASGYFYVNYTDRDDPNFPDEHRFNTVIARYRVSGAPNVADPNSATTILTVAQPYENHNGGQIQFGADGFLYVAMGDGGSGGDPQNRAQNLGTLLGKMLRIDVTPGPAPYTIPASNPFLSTPGARGEIWSYGLRNPWRFSFDRLTHDMFIGDVGQGAVEEIDFQPASSAGGENYGWRIMEGGQCFPAGSSCSSTGLVLPVLTYAHTLGCSVSGGYRYRGRRFPQLGGLYFYGDFCSGRLWGGRPGTGSSWTSTMIVDTSYSISTFGEDAGGEIYVANYGSTVYRIILTEIDPLGDHDSDIRTDHVVYHPPTGNWYVRPSTASSFAVTFGGPGYQPLRGDFDGDGKADLAAYHASSGLWFIRRSSTGASTSEGFGGPQYVPVPGDYDADGKTDVATYHPPSGLWFVRPSSTGIAYSVGFGGSGYSPVRGDFDGDGRTDIAVYHAATALWYIRPSSTGIAYSVGFGGASYSAVPGDYDKDGKTDLATYHSSGLWFIRQSSTGTTISFGLGGANYVPVRGDFDGDGRSDAAVYHSTSGLWYVRPSATGVVYSVPFGSAETIPVG
jgi:glucose/arabinose dehydrogenase